MTDDNASPQAPRTIEVATTPTRVVFFEDRARVTRRAHVTLPQGRTTLVLKDLTALVDDMSATAFAPDGEVEIVAVRIERRLQEEPRGDDSTIESIQHDVDEASAAQEHTRTERVRLHAALKRVRTLEETARRALFDDLSKQTQPAGAWSEAMARLDIRYETLFHEIASVERDYEEATRALRQAEERLARARRVTQRLTGIMKVHVEASQPHTDLIIECEYITPCALWRPSHRAQLERDHGRIVWETQATVWQTTGEQWEGIIAEFSTARPTQASTPPSLIPDLLVTRPKTAEELHITHVEARDVDIVMAGARGPRHLDEMPGVDDGGEPLKFTTRGRVDIPSTGEPVHVDLARHLLDARVIDLVVYPERSDVVHHRARATWEGETPLLAGPVTLFRDKEMVGIAPVSFVAPGAPFEVGFGEENDIHVRRRIVRQEVDRRMSRWTRRLYRIECFVTNVSDTPHKLTVVERLPVSEIEGVVVTPLSLPDGISADEDGLIHIPVVMAAHARERLEFSYHLDTAPKVRLDM